MVIQNIQSNKLSVRILCGLVILISGVIIGIGTTIILVKQRVMWINVPHKDANEVTEIINKKYGLTEQQTQQISVLLHNAFQQKNFRDAEEDKRREADAQQMIADMNTILTPEQFVRWNTDFQAMRDNFKKHLKK